MGAGGIILGGKRTKRVPNFGLLLNKLPEREQAPCRQGAVFLLLWSKQVLEEGHMWPYR